jgi:hypothetical protein
MVEERVSRGDIPGSGGSGAQGAAVSGEVVSPPVALDDVRLSPSALPARVRERLSAVAEVRDDDHIRVLRCRGKSYLDLVAQRAGKPSPYADQEIRAIFFALLTGLRQESSGPINAS